MQGYFSYFPDLNYVSRSTDRSSNDEFIPVKNIFRRPKLRDDLKNVVTAFEDYIITGDDRPEQVAERVYGDPRYDWVVLTTNNITKVRDQWPLSANDFQNYILAKYGTEERLTEVHHYVTELLIDESFRAVVPEGLIVDSNFESRYLEDGSEITYSGTDLPNLSSVDYAGTVRDASGNVVSLTNVCSVSNYEYEEKVNNRKRIINILRPKYLNVVFDDLEEIMTYKEGSTQYVSETLKRGDNIRLYQ